MRILPQSSVRARAGHRPCNVKPGQVHEAKLAKDSQRVRRRKDYVNNRFRRGPTHPRVAHSYLSALGYTLHVCKDLGLRVVMVYKQTFECIRHGFIQCQTACVQCMFVAPGSQSSVTGHSICPAAMLA